MISVQMQPASTGARWGATQATPLELVFDVLRRSPPVVWPDTLRRRIWAEYLGEQIVTRLGSIWSEDRQRIRAAEDAIGAILFLGPPPKVDALERGDWALKRADEILRALLPLVEMERPSRAPTAIG
jgi:hypothetical protein